MCERANECIHGKISNFILSGCDGQHACRHTQIKTRAHTHLLTYPRTDGAGIGGPAWSRNAAINALFSCLSPLQEDQISQEDYDFAGVRARVPAHVFVPMCLRTRDVQIQSLLQRMFDITYAYEYLNTYAGSLTRVSRTITHVRIRALLRVRAKKKETHIYTYLHTCTYTYTHTLCSRDLYCPCPAPLPSCVLLRRFTP